MFEETQHIHSLIKECKYGELRMGIIQTLQRALLALLPAKATEDHHDRHHHHHQQQQTLSKSSLLPSEAIVRRETRKSRFDFSKENIIRVTGIISKVKIKAIKSSPMVVPEKECGNVDIG